jgi:hypothetical protein
MRALIGAQIARTLMEQQPAPRASRARKPRRRRVRLLAALAALLSRGAGN